MNTRYIKQDLEGKNNNRLGKRNIIRIIMQIIFNLALFLILIFLIYEIFDILISEVWIKRHFFI